MLVFVLAVVMVMVRFKESMMSKRFQCLHVQCKCAFVFVCLCAGDSRATEELFQHLPATLLED